MSLSADLNTIVKSYARVRGKAAARVDETRIHRAVVNHLHARAKPGVVWFHVPNGGRRDGKTGAQLKRLGVKRGVSDLILINRGRVFALELKSPKGRPTVEQMEFISNINAAGGFGCIAAGLDQALKTLVTWGLIRPDANARAEAA